MRRLNFLAVWTMLFITLLSACGVGANYVYESVEGYYNVCEGDVDTSVYAASSTRSFEEYSYRQLPFLIEPSVQLSARPFVYPRELPGTYHEAHLDTDKRRFSADAELLVSRLEAGHPMFVIEGALYERYEQVRDEYLYLTSSPMTKTEFILATQRFLAPLGDGHLGRTFLSRFHDNEFFQDGNFIDHHFISRPYGMFLADENGVMIDYEIIGIGRVSTQDILAIIDTYYGRYNEFGAMRNHGRYARYELMLHRAGAQLVNYGGQLATELTLWQENSDGSGILTRKLVGFTDSHPSGYRVARVTRSINRHRFDDVLYINLHSMSPHVDVDSINWAIDNAIDEGVRKFIIDVRDNPGGLSLLGNQLLEPMGVRVPIPGMYIRTGEHTRGLSTQMLLSTWRERAIPINEELVFVPPHGTFENPYDVFIVVLTSNRSFSSAPLFASFIVDSGLGIVIGEPPASGFTVGAEFNNDSNIFLPLSGVTVRSTFTRVTRLDNEACTLVLWPDIWVNEWEALDTALKFLAELD